MSGRTLTDAELRARVVELYKTMGLNEVAKQLGIHHHRVRKILIDEGETIRPQHVSRTWMAPKPDILAALKRRAVELYQRMAYEKVAKELKVPPRHVREWLVEELGELRHCGTRPPLAYRDERTRCERCDIILEEVELTDGGDRVLHEADSPEVRICWMCREELAEMVEAR